MIDPLLKLIPASGPALLPVSSGLRRATIIFFMVTSAFFLLFTLTLAILNHSSLLNYATSSVFTSVEMVVVYGLWFCALVFGLPTLMLIGVCIWRGFALLATKTRIQGK